MRKPNIFFSWSMISLILLLSSQSLESALHLSRATTLAVVIFGSVIAGFVYIIQTRQQARKEQQAIEDKYERKMQDLLATAAGSSNAPRQRAR